MTADVNAARVAWLGDRTEAVNCVAHGEAVVADVHQLVRDLEGDVTRDGRAAHAYRLRAGFVRRMAVYASVEEAFVALNRG